MASGSGSAPTTDVAVDVDADPTAELEEVLTIPDVPVDEAVDVQRLQSPASPASLQSAPGLSMCTSTLCLS